MQAGRNSLLRLQYWKYFFFFFAGWVISPALRPYIKDIDTATVVDIARFIKKISEIPIEYPALTGTTGDGWWTRIVV